METERVKARVIEQKRKWAPSAKAHPFEDLGLDGYPRQVMPVFTQTRDENAGVPPGNSRSTWSDSEELSPCGLLWPSREGSQLCNNCDWILGNFCKIKLKVLLIALSSLSLIDFVVGGPKTLLVLWINCPNMHSDWADVWKHLFYISIY